jgi:regulator of sirC expression with transglutaminase-like and TPR domain
MTVLLCHERFQGICAVPHKPVVCRPEAFWLFSQQLTQLYTADGLWKAITAISMHALEDVQLQDVDERFRVLTERVLAGARSGRHEALLAHLHCVLFEQEGFAGDTDTYYSPLNSYLPAVLENRRGIPILLSLVYKVVAERIGLRVEGINSPGHFLVSVLADGKWLIVDPFFHGQMLTRDEALERLTDLTGRSMTGQLEALKPATHYQWLARVLNNLQNVFATEGRQSDLAAMSELQKLLWESAEP